MRYGVWIGAWVIGACTGEPVGGGFPVKGGEDAEQQPPAEMEAPAEDESAAEVPALLPDEPIPPDGPDAVFAIPDEVSWDGLADAMARARCGLDLRCGFAYARTDEDSCVE